MRSPDMPRGWVVSVTVSTSCPSMDSASRSPLAEKVRFTSSPAVTGASDAIRATYTAGVVGDVGAFGGLFDLDRAGVSGQLMVASTDGVGTKVMIAAQRGDMSTVGEDLVNHCVDDILVQGARPLFFLDYIAMSQMVPERVQQVIHGLAKACSENGCALLGGETAEMPGVYRDGEVDVAGTIVGSVAREQLLDGSRIQAGDQLVGLPSAGLHTNGFSLARQVLFEDAGFALEDTPDELEGASVGDALLAVHRSYLAAVHALADQQLARSFVHVTGGGIPGNTPRALGEHGFEVDYDAWQRPGLFRLIQRLTQ